MIRWINKALQIWFPEKVESQSFQEWQGDKVIKDGLIIWENIRTVPVWGKLKKIQIIENQSQFESGYDMAYYMESYPFKV